MQIDLLKTKKNEYASRCYLPRELWRSLELEKATKIVDVFSKHNSFSGSEPLSVGGNVFKALDAASFFLQ